MNSMGPIIAASAAAAAQQRAEEEERMTTYSTDDLQNDWEFKIVRGNSDAFRNHAALTRLQNEEKQAGWVLLEKLDNGRIRFKRQRAIQAHDEQLLAQGIDPYRTQYGRFPMSSAMIIMVGLIFMLLMTAIFIMFSFSMRP